MQTLVTVLPREAIRTEVIRFSGLLSALGVPAVRVWCSYNPDLPDDSALQSPDRIVPPDAAPAFFDAAVRDGVWTYGDNWNRAAIEALDGLFVLFLGNDKDVRLETGDRSLLDPMRSAWQSEGYYVRQHDGDSS